MRTYENGILKRTANSNRLHPQPSRRHLGKDSISRRANSNIIKEAINDNQSRNTLQTIRSISNSKTTHDPKNTSNQRQSPESERSSPNPIDQQPRTDIAEHGSNLLHYR